MAESRKHKKQKREELRKMLAGSRSDALELDLFDLNSMPDLMGTDSINVIIYHFTNTYF
jgi:hypothetical protein